MLGSTVLHFHPLRSTKVCVWGVPCYVFIHYGVPGCVCSAVPCYALVRRVPRSAFWGVPCYVVFIHRVLRCTFGTTVLRFHQLRSTEVFVFGVPCYTFILEYRRAFGSTVPHSIHFGVPRCTFGCTETYVVELCVKPVLSCGLGSTVLRPYPQNTEVCVWKYRATFHLLWSTEVCVLGVRCYTFISEYRRAFGSTVPHSINFGVPRCAFWEYRVTPSFRSTDVRLGVSCHIPSTSEYRGVSLGSTVLAPSFRSTEVYVWMYRATSLSTEYRDVRC